MSLLQTTNYHRFLRVAASVTALVLVFESGLVSHSTQQLSLQTKNYLANAIGMSASVEPNGLNEITAELARRQKELDAREASLNEREIAVDLSTDVPRSDTFTYLMAAILFILLILIVLNYTLDYLRMKESRDTQPV